MDTRPPLIEIRSLTKRYESFEAVTDLPLTVAQEDLFALLGPNGAGKTTTIRMLMGILQSTSGTARISGLNCFSQRCMATHHAIGAAPVFEEFIFRGLLRSTSTLTATVGSAAVFAIVHPPISVIPVFVLGVLAAWTFQRSKLLISAVATHTIYNAAVVALNWHR